METVTLNTKSYLFQNAEGQFRAIPFYEHPIDNYVIFENGHPKYLLDFNRQNKPLVQDITKRLNCGEALEEAVQKLGRFLGRQWTTIQKIEGVEIPNSQQAESVTLSLLDNLADLFMDVYIVATNTIDTAILLNEDKFVKAYVTDIDEQGFESVYAENKDELIRLLCFIFNKPVSLNMIGSNSEREVYDLTEFSVFCIADDELDLKYKQWIKDSRRENAMDQYGFFTCAVSYINNKRNKKHLVIVTEKRRHW